MKCTRCGASNDASVNFCASCGTDMSSSAPIIPPPANPTGRVWPILRLGLLGLLAAVPCSAYGILNAFGASSTGDSYAASWNEFMAVIAFALAAVCTFIAVPLLWATMGHRKKNGSTIFDSRQVHIPFWGMCLITVISVMFVILIGNAIRSTAEPTLPEPALRDYEAELQRTGAPIPAVASPVPESTPTTTPEPTATAVPTVIPTISVSVEYYQQAEGLHQEENFREAIESYSKAIDADPMFVKAYYKRGSSLLELKQYEEAIADFDFALDLSDYHDPAIYGKRGHAFRLLGRYEESISEYETQKQKDPTNAWPYHYIGMSFFEMGRYQEAIASWGKYAEIRVAEGDSRAADIYGRIGEAYMKLGMYEEALRRFEMALEINPNNGNMIAKRDEARGLSRHSTPTSRAENSADQRGDYFDLAMRSFESQSYEDAIDNLTKALDDHPDPHQVYIMRSIVYLAKESFGDALRDIDLAIIIDSNYTQQYALRAEANYGLGNIDEFEADFTTARESDPQGADFFIQREDELRIDGRHAIADIYRKQACILQDSYCK